jgi:hypothetical protein
MSEHSVSNIFAGYEISYMSLCYYCIGSSQSKHSPPFPYAQLIKSGEIPSISLLTQLI